MTQFKAMQLIVGCSPLAPLMLALNFFDSFNSKPCMHVMIL